MTKAFKYVGRSEDGRTNRWRLDLPCGHGKNPLSSLFNTQHVQCDECDKRYIVNYDKLTIVEE